MMTDIYTASNRVRKQVMCQSVTGNKGITLILLVSVMEHNILQ